MTRAAAAFASLYSHSHSSHLCYCYAPPCLLPMRTCGSSQIHQATIRPGPERARYYAQQRAFTSTNDCDCVTNAKSVVAVTRRRLLTLGVLLSLLLLQVPVSLPSHAAAMDYNGGGGMTCVASHCRRELSMCLANDFNCAQGLACFIKCSVQSTQEGACQTRCMDLYQSPLLDAFTECTLTDHACYPPLESDPRYPPLDHYHQNPEQLWQSNLLLSSEPEALQNLFTGIWYLSAGLNPAFDTFDCQMHEFRRPAPPNNAKVKNGGGGGVPIADATFSYRIQLNNDGRWFTRTGDKRLTLVDNKDSTFDPNGKKWRRLDQGLKWGIDSFLDDDEHHYDNNDIKSKKTTSSTNNDNKNVHTRSPRLVLTLRPDFMNYKDDWVVLDSSPESYIVLLYRGTNSAWKGYGGLNVYTRTRTISDTLKPNIERGLSKVNLSLRDLTIVDNSCRRPKE